MKTDSLSRRTGVERLLDLPPTLLALLSAFLLPLPQTLLVSAIATAALGPGLGLLALLLVGSGNVIVTAGLSAAIARLGADIGGKTTLPAVAGFYLGPIGRNVATFAILTMWFTALVGGLLGFVDVMAGLTQTDPIPWLVGLCIMVIVLNKRKSLGFSVMLMLSLVTFAILLVIIFSLLPLVSSRALRGHVAGPELLSLPAWASVIAISFYTFFGASLLAPTAAFVLPRDASGQAFIRGSIAGSVGLIVLVMAWLGLVSSVLPRQELINMSGTVLVALGQKAGSFHSVMCASLAVALSGFSAIRAGGVLGNQLRDIPASRSAIGRLLLPALPTLAGVFLILSWMHLGQTNLTATLSVGGGLGIPIGCWIIPGMIIRQTQVSRQDKTSGLMRMVSHPMITTSLIIVGLCVLLVFGIFVWTWWPIKVFTTLLAIALAAWAAGGRFIRARRQD